MTPASDHVELSDFDLLRCGENYFNKSQGVQDQEPEEISVVVPHNSWDNDHLG